MRGAYSRFGIRLAALTMVVSGCGQDPFSPPSRPRPNLTTGSNQAPKATYLVMITPGLPSSEVEVWGLNAQREANIRQAIFRVMGPSVDQALSEQADFVRKALADNASALVVVPGDSPDLGKALAEAESKGVPVILIARSIPSPAGSKPFTVVDHGEFEESARKIVETALEDAKKVGRSAAGTALVMVDRVTDISSTQRVAALKAAAEQAGFRKVVTVPFAPTQESSARLAILEAVKANPDVAIVLADNSDSMAGASEARIELQGKPSFFVGGYNDFGITRKSFLPSKESCSFEGKFGDLGTLAVKTAMARLRGEPVDPHVVLTPKFVRGSGLVATADDLRMMRP